MSPAGVSCQGHHALGTGALTDYLSTAAQRGNLGILCGAGVSLWAPSNKPLADWLKGYLFELLAGPDNDLRSRTDLSFEKTISILGWGIEFALERCYGGQRDGPNAWHHLIAGLMAQTMVRAVFTTNFDRLIERALDERGAQYQVIDLVTYRPDPAEDPGESDPPMLRHIHGTFDVFNMIASLPQVLDFSEAEGIWGSLTSFLKNKERVLLVLGYSASDPDLEYVLDRVGQELQATAVLVELANDVVSPCFRHLGGALKSGTGFSYCVPSYERFLERLWRDLGIADWELLGLRGMSRQRQAPWPPGLPRLATGT